MAPKHRGTTPVDRVRSRFETTEPTCSACGFEDSDGEWTAKTDGSQILYRHVCPRCGEIRTRTYRLGGSRSNE